MKSQTRTVKCYTLRKEKREQGVLKWVTVDLWLHNEKGKKWVSIDISRMYFKRPRKYHYKMLYSDILSGGYGYILRIMENLLKRGYNLI